MFLKIMSGENSPDSDSRKAFHLLDHVESADITRDDGKATVAVTFADGGQEDFEIPGNAYLMNSAGETVATFGSAAYRRAA